MPRSASLFAVLGLFGSQAVHAFQFPSIPTFLKPPTDAGGGGGNAFASSLTQKKAQLLETVSYTQNGKMAEPPTQAKVLSIVRGIETSSPFGSLSNPDEAKALDGTWYLQYTSPSQIENEKELIDTWTPVDVSTFDFFRWLVDDVSKVGGLDCWIPLAHFNCVYVISYI